MLGGNLVGAWGLKEVMPVSVFQTPQLFSFENIEINGVSDSDEYLTRQYDEWWKLPPKEKQVSHHAFYLDLQSSYLQRL